MISRSSLTSPGDDTNTRTIETGSDDRRIMPHHPCGAISIQQRSCARLCDAAGGGSGTDSDATWPLQGRCRTVLKSSYTAATSLYSNRLQKFIVARYGVTPTKSC